MEFKKTTWRLKRECEVNNTEKQRRRDTEREKQRLKRRRDTERGRDKGFFIKTESRRERGEFINQ